MRERLRSMGTNGGAAIASLSLESDPNSSLRAMRKSAGTPDAFAPQEASVMVGVVTTRHLFTHSAVIVREFGTLCLFRCIWRSLTADHAVTFLECAATR